MARTGNKVAALIVDSFGTIRGLVPRRPAPPEGEDAPTGAAMEPGPGRRMVEVAVDAKVGTLDFEDLVRGYRVSLRGKPRLVRVRPPAPVAPPVPEPRPAKKAPSRTRRK